MNSSEQKPDSRSWHNTIYNHAWLQAVGELCLAGVPLCHMPDKLALQGLQPVDPRSIVKYLRDGRIPDVTEERYARARRARRDVQRHLCKSRHIPKVWDAAVGQLISEGRSLAAISGELKRRGLQPSSTYVISQRLAAGQISGQTKESYERAKRARRERLFRQWCGEVRPLLLSGCPITEVERWLLSRNQRYASETSIRQLLYAGKIEGVTVEQYQAAVSLRKQGSGAGQPAAGSSDLISCRTAPTVQCEERAQA